MNVDKNIVPGILIAAPSSGSGKTTLSRGIMAALRARGLTVQPFKCGPDYIDTKYHGAACGRASVNLDLFMATDEHVRGLYNHYTSLSEPDCGGRRCDVAVVEGMMGLYDGYKRGEGSSAAVAMTLGLPVLLVVDARSTGFSVAPLLKGMKEFDHRLEVAGVIFNRVGSERHAAMMREAAEAAGVECLGCVPRCSEVEQASRYLGLDFDRSAVEDGLEILADIIRRHVDLERLLEIMHLPAHVSADDAPAWAKDSKDHKDSKDYEVLDEVPWRVMAVAFNNESFSFVYREHLDMLARYGRVVMFDPEADEVIPPGTELLYLPGGYPERHAEALEAAAKCRGSIREYAARGGRIIAECGGMMYLCGSMLLDGEPASAEMVGVLPMEVTARKTDRRLRLGYRSVVFDEALKGAVLRGHEFHYTKLTDPHLLPSAATVTDARGADVDSPIYLTGSTVASYTHLYWGMCDLPGMLINDFKQN
ncbi:MAG: cobyrinate a,c-diamide synthase [Paramuribaculum sp.]|nr:cobyrinate a,c-diamide synthase [Paramuribaculum sp.]